MFDLHFFANKSAPELLNNLWTEDELFATITISGDPPPPPPSTSNLQCSVGLSPRGMILMLIQAYLLVPGRSIAWLDLPFQQCECGAGGRDLRNPCFGPHAWLAQELRPYYWAGCPLCQVNKFHMWKKACLLLVVGTRQLWWCDLHLESTLLSPFRAIK